MRDTVPQSLPLATNDTRPRAAARWGYRRFAGPHAQPRVGPALLLPPASETQGRRNNLLPAGNKFGLPSDQMSKLRRIYGRLGADELSELKAQARLSGERSRGRPENLAFSGHMPQKARFNLGNYIQF